MLLRETRGKLERMRLLDSESQEGTIAANIAIISEQFQRR